MIAHLIFFTEDVTKPPRSRTSSGSLGYFVKESANLAVTKRTVNQCYRLARTFNSLEDEI